MTKAPLLIAVVDDEEPVRKAFMRLMRSVGLSVEAFASGAEFLKSLDTRLPDCVVLDLHMPRIDGFNLQASLARNYAALPVIIVTGHDLLNARERAMAGGASAFLRKPVHARTLLGAISAATACAEPGTPPHEVSFQNFGPQFFGEGWSKMEAPIPNRDFPPERSRARSPELPKQMSWIATGMAPGQPKENTQNKMKTQNKPILLITLALSFAIANTVSANFFQGFETNTSGWDVFGGNFNATRVASGTNGITSHTGSFHAEAPGPFQLCTTGGSAATNWGGFSRPFPVAGWTTDIWVYLDMAATTTNDTRFDWIASSVDMPDCEFRRDFGFNFGWYNDSDFTGTGPRFVVSGNTNTGRCHSFPKNPGMDPFTITATGWYKLEGQFENNAGVLSVSLRVFDSSGTQLHQWVRSDPTDIIGTTVGGNRYGWFSSNEFPFLAFDDSSLTGIQIYCDAGSGPAATQGYWMNHPNAWCDPSMTIGGVTRTTAEAITMMQHATNRDMTYQMFAQLVAAELNINCLGSDSSCVADAIQAAESFMEANPVGSLVRANSSDWKAVTWAYNTLVNYNEGLLCAPHIQ